MQRELKVVPVESSDKNFLIKDWCGNHLWIPSCYHGSVGNGWDVVERYISAHNTYEYNR